MSGHRQVQHGPECNCAECYVDSKPRVLPVTLGSLERGAQFGIVLFDRERKGEVVGRIGQTPWIATRLGPVGVYSRGGDVRMTEWVAVALADDHLVRVIAK